MIYNYMRGESESGGEINAYCPNCQPSGEGKDKRLYYKIVQELDGSEKILAHCKHGCMFEDIIKFFPKSNGSQSKQWVLLREHIYYNPGGGIFGKKCYYMINGKKSPMWYRYENGEYKSGLNGAKAGLYNINDLMSSDENKIVWLVEGEKDADNMKKRGLLAVSPPNGAGYWRADFNQYFRNRNVVIIPDNDEAGAKHIEKLAKNLSKTAKTVKLIDLTDIVPELKKGGDVSDVFELVPGADSELMRLVCETESEKTRNAGICYATDYNGKPYKTFDNFKIMLDYHSISIKNNSVSGIEFEGSLPNVSDENIENVMLAYLYSLSQETGINLSYNEISSYIMMCADYHYYNPVADWLGKSDKTKRGYARKYFDCLVFDESEKANADFYYILFVKWLIQCVALQFNNLKEPIAADGALGLQSWNEAIGKTTFFRKLSFSPKLFKDGISLDPNNKDSIRIATSFWICELGEVESTMNRDFPRLKAFITEMFDVYRLPYARNPTTRPRRTSYCFTCNSDKFLREGDNRRFWTIPIININRNELNKIDTADIWGEIYAYYLDNPMSYKLSPEEIQFLAENNRDKFSVMSNEEAVLRDKFNFAKEAAAWSYMTSADISVKLFNNTGFARNIGKIMTQKLGYAKDNGQAAENNRIFRIRQGIKEYFVPLKTDGFNHF